MMRVQDVLRLAAMMALAIGAWPGQVRGQGEAPVHAIYQLTAFGVGPLAEGGYSNTLGGDPLQLAKNHVSNPIKAALREGAFLDFYGQGAEEGQPPAFSVRVPAGNRSDLLVVLMHQAEEVKPLMIDLKAIRLQRGGQYFYNLLPMAIAVQCGEGATPVAVQPGKTCNISAPAADKVIQALYYSDSGGKPVKFSSSIYFKDSGCRQIVFCYSQNGSKRPKVAPICIYDRAPEPER